MRLKVVNLHKSYSINSRLVKKIVSRILEYCKETGAIDLELVFLSNAGIKVLNKKYKGAPGPTDVLSFDLSGKTFGMEAPLVASIFISIDMAFKNSKVFGAAPEEELTLYMIHGILHLLGYDDGTEKARARMEKRQAGILKSLCTREDLSKVLTPL
ncbi:MAG: rRNA maturation RNase YbeY [Candidatus Omnitrophica bacterium]|nr:rRNA maturation RNase YbeY [Candidatus Omnitrophota bacterium]MDD5436354.1 rRNA maturation RNase YbeY [Candidatus Omnitrophota bacterium]